MVTNMVMEEQKDNLELKESSLDKQEGNIQEINSAEAQLEENAENVDEVNALEENAKNQDEINELDQVDDIFSVIQLRFQLLQTDVQYLLAQAACIGVRARGANYDPFNLVAVGLEMGGTFRFIPYVHPIVRFGLNYAKLTDLPDTGTNLKSDGVAVDVGVGVRIPIIRWISFAATFNWSFIGMFVRDNDTSAEAVLGQQLTGMFALTFHFIGVRKGD